MISFVACGGKQSNGDDATLDDAGGCISAHCIPEGGVGPIGDGGIPTPPPVRDGGSSTTDAGVACSTMCGGACVSAEDPNHGCGTCKACASVANGTPTCNTGACSTACNPGYSACDTGCCACGDTQSDAKNCGYCGHDCGSAACSKGICENVVLATAQVDAYAVAVDETNVYWIVEGTGGDGAVMKLPLSGAGDPIPVAQGLSYPAAITVDAQNVYFATIDAVMSAPVGGGSVKTLGNIMGSPAGIAVDKSQVYVSLAGYSPMDKGSLIALPLTGGSQKILADNLDQPRAVSANATSVYFADATDVFSVASGNTHTYAAQQYAYAITADSTHVFWTSGLDNGAVFQGQTKGGPAIKLARNQFYPNAIAADGKDVFFTVGQGGGGHVMRVPIGGGTPVALAAGQAYPTSVAVNSTHVFWVNFGTGTINSVPK